MKQNIILKIESLPPLPESVIKLEEFRKKSDKEPKELVVIIEKDPLMIASLLKIANSAIFNFRNKVETPSRAVSLLGINFTISIALGTVMQDIIKSNLSSYGVNTNEFLDTCNLTAAIIHKWVKDPELMEELLLPAFLQETGKFIISEIIAEERKEEEFQKKISEAIDISSVEEEFVGSSCAKITASIFKHWKLSPNLVNSIGYVGNKEVPQEFKTKAQILEIVKILCTINHPLNKKVVDLAIDKAKEYDLDYKHLELVVEEIVQKMNENKEK